VQAIESHDNTANWSFSHQHLCFLCAIGSISEQSLAAPFPETRRPSHAAKSTLESIDSLGTARKSLAGLVRPQCQKTSLPLPAESLALGSKSDISVRSGTSWRQAEQRWATTDVYLATVRTGNTVTGTCLCASHVVRRAWADGPLIAGRLQCGLSRCDTRWVRASPP
jgi:hypothetical protein